MGIVPVGNPPTFRDGQVISATELNKLRDIALWLDEASRYGYPLVPRFYGQNSTAFQDNPVTIWHGGFVFWTGMTTLRIIVNAVSPNTGQNDRLVVYRSDDTSVSTTHALANGSQTFDITISGAGYANGQVVPVRIQAASNETKSASTPWCTINIETVEALPVGLSDAYVAAPTWNVATTDNISAADLTTLRNSAAWLLRRVGLRVEPLQQQVRRALGPLWDGSSSTTNTRLDGSVVRSADFTSLVVSGEAFVLYGGMTESINLYYNGSLAASHSVTATGAWSLSATMTHTVGTYAAWHIEYVRTADPNDTTPANRWTVSQIEVQASGGTASSLAEQTMLSSGTYSSLKGWLNSLSGILTTVKSRIDANPQVWDTQRVYRARYGRGTSTELRWFEPQFVAANNHAAGDAIIVRGKAISIAYGAVRFTEDYNDIGAQAWETSRSATVIDGDDIESVRFALGSAVGLTAGAPYALRGEDLSYAGEQLKVVV